MYVIVGLGNPTRKYEGTRHNVGFETIDKIAEEFGIKMNEHKHKAVCGKGMIGSQKVILAKPQTFMNLSGESVRAIADFYKVSPEDFIIIHDDIDLPVGHLRIRKDGSAGGHNGMKNIILHMGTQNIPRIRIGVGGKPDGWDLADYVLSAYNKEDRKTMDQAQENAMKAVALIVEDEFSKAMNLYNTKKPPKPKKPKKQTQDAENTVSRNQTQAAGNEAGKDQAQTAGNEAGKDQAQIAGNTVGKDQVQAAES